MGQVAGGLGSTSLPAGDYASFQPLTNLIGCPLNGEWTLTICDNWSIDEGYIFGWHISMVGSLYNEAWSYSSDIHTHGWTGQYGVQFLSPINENCSSGTYNTTDSPEINTMQSFIFTVVDYFGCEHQTEVEVMIYGEDLCPEDPIGINTNYNDNQKILLYPNPAGDYVKIANITDNSNLKIFDSKGRLLSNTIVCNNEIVNVSDLKTGIYTFKITYKNGEIRLQRFVKE